MPQTMRAIDIKGGSGPISSLYMNEKFPKPTPQENEALVHVKAFGVNGMDLIQREGRYPLPPYAKGLPLGVEFSGVIESIGSASSDHQGRMWQVGDEVFGLTYGGAYAEYVVAGTHMLLRKPEELNWEVCAGIPETWITAIQALYIVGEFSAGKSVLWHAGASGVSIAGIQLAKSGGAKNIYVTASSQEKVNFCRRLGADEGFSYNEGDWSSKLLEATDGRGVDIIIDFVGGPYFDQNLDSIAKGGHIVCLAVLGGTSIEPKRSLQGVDMTRLIVKHVRIEGSMLRSRDKEYQARLKHRLEEYAMPKLINGSFKALIQGVYAWQDVQDAHRMLEQKKTAGKIICLVDWS